MIESILTVTVLGAIYMLVDFVNRALLDFFRKRWPLLSRREWNTSPTTGIDEDALV